MIEQAKIKIVLTDGSISIMTIVLNDFAGIKRDYSPELVDHLIARTDLACARWERIIDADLPDREYRDAWCDGGPRKIGHDMVKARQIHRDKIKKDHPSIDQAQTIEELKAITLDSLA